MLQYGTIQQMLFVMGIFLALGVVVETGFFASVAVWLDRNVHDALVMGAASGLLSAVVDSFTVFLTNVALYPVADATQTLGTDSYAAAFMQNGAFWKILAYSTGVGGCLLCFTTTSGLALMKMERMRVGWYLTNCSAKILAGWAAGLAILWGELLLTGGL